MNLVKTLQIFNWVTTTSFSTKTTQNQSSTFEIENLDTFSFTEIHPQVFPFQHFLAFAIIFDHLLKLSTKQSKIISIEQLH